MTQTDLTSSANLLASSIDFPLRPSRNHSEDLYDPRNGTNPRRSSTEYQASRSLSLDTGWHSSLDGGECSRPPTMVSYSTVSQATETSTPDTCSLAEPPQALEKHPRALVGMTVDISTGLHHARFPSHNTSRNHLSLNTDMCEPNRDTSNLSQRPEGSTFSEQSDETPRTPTLASKRTSSDSWSDRLARTFSGRRRLNHFKMILPSEGGQETSMSEV